METRKSLLSMLFSTRDPIADYRRKQDEFVSAMKHLSDGDDVQDYRTPEIKGDARCFPGMAPEQT